MQGVDWLRWEGLHLGDNFLLLHYAPIVFLNAITILSPLKKHMGDLGQQLSQLQSKYVIKQKKNQPTNNVMHFI